MQALATAAEWFIGLFKAGADNFVGLVTGIVPLLIVLMTFVNALIALIGADKIDKVGEAAAKEGIIYYPIRYIDFAISFGVLPDKPDGIHNGGALPA